MPPSLLILLILSFTSSSLCQPARPNSYEVASCSVPMPCLDGYSCFSCLKGKNAICVLPIGTFPGMACCKSYGDHFSSCNIVQDSSCCNGSNLSPGVVAAIVLGSSGGMVLLGCIAWYIARKIRKSNEEHPEMSPTIQAEIYLPLNSKTRVSKQLLLPKETGNGKYGQIQNDPSSDMPDEDSSLPKSAFKNYQSF